VDDQHNAFHTDWLVHLQQRSLTSAKSAETTEESAAAMATQDLDLRERFLNSTADEEIGLKLVWRVRSDIGRIVHTMQQRLHDINPNAFRDIGA
jgi:hypothetical protein